MKTPITTFAAGLALFAAMSASPAVAAVSSQTCASGDAACFFVHDEPASPAEYGMPTRTGSVGRGWQCQRWHEGTEERLLLLGTCSDGSEGRGQEQRDPQPGRGPNDPLR